MSNYREISTYDIETETASGNGTVKLWLAGGSDNPNLPDHKLTLVAAALATVATILRGGKAYFDPSSHRISTGWQKP